MNPLSLASGVVPEFSPVETVRAAACGGFDMVGLWVEPGDWTAQTTREVRAALTDTGLPLLDVEVVWLKPDVVPDDWRKVVDVGAELGARNVLCVSSLPDAGRTAEELRALCEHADGSGQRIALEFGIFTQVGDLEAALAVLARVDHPAAALLVDPIHVDRSGSSIERIASLHPALLPYAQICDAPAERPNPDDFDAVITDAIDLREQCGEGALPLADLYAALPPNIPLSVELRSKALRDAYSDPGKRAAAVADATRAWLRNLPASTGR